MRPECRKKVTVRGRVIGGPKVQVCVPLVAEDRASLPAQAAAAMKWTPDLIEWRVDAFVHAEDPDACLRALAELRAVIGGTPLIFTCRMRSEGGFRDLSPEARLNLVLAAVGTGETDLVDVETANGPEFIGRVRERTASAGAALILSHHDFESSVRAGWVYERLVRCRDLGADVAKVAVTPRDPREVLALFEATLKARETLDIPLIAIGMGPEGRLTRLAGGLFGSDLTFALGSRSSAPGQIPLGDLRRAMSILY